MSRNNRARQQARAGGNHLYSEAHLKLLGLVWPLLSGRPLDSHKDLQEAVESLIGKDDYLELNKLLSQLRPDRFFHACPHSGCKREIPPRLKALQVLAMTNEYSIFQLEGRTCIGVPAGEWSENPRDYKDVHTYH